MVSSPESIDQRSGKFRRYRWRRAVRIDIGFNGPLSISQPCYRDPETAIGSRWDFEADLLPIVAVSILRRKLDLSPFAGTSDAYWRAQLIAMGRCRMRWVASR